MQNIAKNFMLWTLTNMLPLWHHLQKNSFMHDNNTHLEYTQQKYFSYQINAITQNCRTTTAETANRNQKLYTRIKRRKKNITITYANNAPVHTQSTSQAKG